MAQAPNWSVTSVSHVMSEDTC